MFTVKSEHPLSAANSETFRSVGVSRPVSQGRVCTAVTMQNVVKSNYSL